MSDLLVIGCGYLGRRIAERRRAAGQRVFATTGARLIAPTSFTNLVWNPFSATYSTPTASKRFRRGRTWFTASVSTEHPVRRCATSTSTASKTC